MEAWMAVIEIVLVFILFVASANITVSRLTLPQPAANKKTDLPAPDTQREIRLTCLSAMTSIVFMALFSWLAVQFFIF